MQGQSLAAVDLVRQRVGADFHVVLRGALYEREQLRKFQPTEVHYALARLALESQPPYPCLHTTNYDDLLELTIANMQSGKRPRAVHATRRSSADGPRVVHLHGYFPYDFPGAAEDKRLAAELVASRPRLSPPVERSRGLDQPRADDAARLALGARSSA